MSVRYRYAAVLLIAGALTLPSLRQSADAAPASSSAYLPDSSAAVLPWTFDETPPKRPNPKLLNAAAYAAKWKLDNPLIFSLVQDEQGVLFYSDSNSSIHAVYPNGKPKWTAHPDWGYSSSVVQLSIGRDGTVYAFTSSYAILKPPYEDDGPTVVAIAPDGTIKWTLNLAAMVSFASDQFAGDAEGNLALFTEEGLTSYDASGHVRWTNADLTHTNGVQTNVFADADGNFYVNASKGEIVSVDASGTERWRTRAIPDLGIFTSFRTHLSARGTLYLLTREGLQAFNTKDGTAVDLSKGIDAADLRSAGVPTDGSGGFYIADIDVIRKIKRDGSIVWTYALRPTETYGLGPFEEPLADAEGNAIFATGTGNVIELGPDGREKFVFLRNAAWFKMNDLQLGKNGNIYASTNDIGLMAFGRREIQVYADNFPLPMASPPINKAGSVLVPFRSLFESFGLGVGWDPASGTITGTKPGLSIRLTLGSRTAYVNGQPRTLAAAPFVERGVAYIPLRFVGEALNRRVAWEPAGSSIDIDA